MIPAGTLVVNPDATDRLVAFATEADLVWDPSLREFELAGPAPEDDADAATGPIRRGDTSALIKGPKERLEVGRWLVIVTVDPGSPEHLPDPAKPFHVVRVTWFEHYVTTTRVFWDPRRPAPADYEPLTTRMFGNCVPGHHGLPLTPISAAAPTAEQLAQDSDELLRPWREQLTIPVVKGTREVTLPVDPVSVQARGWPLPGDAARQGQPRIALSVDGEPWPLVDDLSVMQPGEEGFALRTADDGGAAVRFGDGITGAVLPDREVALDVSVSIGLGVVGNVRAWRDPRGSSRSGRKAATPPRSCPRTSTSPSGWPRCERTSG